MKRTNEVVEEVVFDPKLPKKWQAGIDMRLEIVLRQKTGSSSRARLLLRVLKRVASKPSVLWLCMKQNQGRTVQGIVDNDLEKKASNSPRKRPRLCSSRAT